MNKGSILSQIRRGWIKAWPAVKIGGLIFLGLAIIGLFAFTVFAAWVSRDLPDPNSLINREVAQSTKIYDRTGTHLLYEIHGDTQRTLVKIEDIPDYAKWATISIEDKGFYQHHGVYWQGWIRAVIMSVIKGQRLQGTSTLTQQFVKLALLSNERSFTRKVKELILSIQLEQRYTKEQILQLYFNEISYGSTIYGIESASQTYFNKSAKNLTLDEAALLAAIPQRPDYYNPYGVGSNGDNRERLVVRQHYILDLMAEQGYITADEAAAAKQIDTLKKLQPRRIGNISAPHFVMYIRSLLSDKYGQREVEEGGLKVITTLDWDKQQIAEDEVVKGVEAKGKQYNFTNAALVSLDPKTGQILSMVGSKDFFDEAHDGQVNVTLRPRQPGSSFKPIVYASAFARGYLPQTQTWDVETDFKTDTGTYHPHDYDGKERGPVSLRQALAGSLNIPAVEMLYMVGIGRVLDFAEELGYTTLGDRSRFGLSLVLGGAEVTPLEHAAAYSAFATEGEYRAPSGILKVEDSNGQTLEEWKDPEPKKVMDEQVARLVSDVLSDNNARSYIFGGRNYLTLPDRPVAAKTGTTNDNHDAWTAGYTPNLVTVVWVGNNNNDEMKKGADGSIVAAPIWQGYMKRALKGMPVERFTAPLPPSTTSPALLGQVVQKDVQVNKLNGKLATASTPPELVETRQVYEAHTILWYIDKDDPTGPPPSNPADDPQFNNWESAVHAWVEKTQWNATSTAPTETDDSSNDATRPSVTVLEPSQNQTIASRTFAVRVSISSTRAINQVEAYLDGTLVGSSLASPFDIQAKIPNSIDKGFHVLRVVAYDQSGLTGETSFNINLTADIDPNQSNLTLVSPQTNELWSRQTFPKQIKIRLENPTLYSRINATFVGSDGIERLVGSVMSPTTEDISILIPAGPPIGPYTLRIDGNRTDGGKETVQTLVNITQ